MSLLTNCWRFLRNVMDFMDEESIHQLCTTSFSEEEIVNAKRLLVDSMPNAIKLPTRRKQGKKRMSRDLDDIICVLKSADPGIFPVFVAKDLHKLPPVTFDHVDVTRLLRDILCLKNQLCALEDRVVSYEDFKELKSEVEHMKYASIIDNAGTNANINKKRGARLQSSFELDSGPIGLNYLTHYSHIKTADSKANGQTLLVRSASSPTAQRKSNEDTSVSITCLQNSETKAAERVEAPAKDVVSNGAKENDPLPSCSGAISAGVSGTEYREGRVEAPASTVVSSTPELRPEFLSEHMCAGASNRFATNDVLVACTESLPRMSEHCKQKVSNCESEWTIVRNKTSKRGYKLVGQMGCASIAPDSKFRAADVKVPLFISNVNKDTSENDIISYIQDKTGDSVTLKKINMKQYKKYDAYKVYVSKRNLELFLKDNFWPNGITFRRFVRFMYNTKGENVSK